jgi:glycosyltransferase involved in cell wall biosynthesis
MEQKTIKILSLKPLTGQSYDAVETTMVSVFKRFPSPPFECSWQKSHTSDLKSIMAGRYDILFGIGNPRELPAILLRPKKTKYVLHYQSIMLKKSEPNWPVRMPWPLRKLIFNQADMVIAPSAFSAGTIKQFFPHLRVEYVLNGIDSVFFQPEKKNPPYLKEKFGIDASRPIVAFVGALQARKRPDVFVNIARRFPDATFVAAGRPVPEVDFLSGTGNIPNFKHINLTSREDVAIFLASIKIFIFPSLREPAALVNLEAMASGAVPIVSKSGGNVEFLHDGVSGYLIPNDEKEVDAFVAVLRKLLNDDALHAKISVAARKEAEAHTWDKAAREYEALFRSLLNGTK